MAARRPTTVAEYLKALPPERRAVVSKVRAAIRRALPRGYREALRWGMISYEIPLASFPDTYNGQPLSYAALAAQKGHYALYLSGAYADGAQRKALAAGFKAAGKSLDMGKSCLRFRKLEDLPLPVVERIVASLPPERFIALYEKARGRVKKG
jgi:hypothetical protein